MDDVQKSRIRLSNWIGHNVEHMRGYAEVAEILAKGEFLTAAAFVREGIGLIEQANSKFEQALVLLPVKEAGTTQADHSDADHHDHHHGIHRHRHEHTE